MIDKNIFHRGPGFWYLQVLGWIFILSLGYGLSFSLISVFCGLIVSFVNMEILIKMMQINWYWISLKYIVLSGLLYIFIPFVDAFSFLLGLSSVFFYLIGLCAKVLEYDSF